MSGWANRELSCDIGIGELTSPYRPAVCGLPKIQMKEGAADQDVEDAEPHIQRLRMEHARLELQMNGLSKLLEKTSQKEDDIKRKFRGQTLHDNKEFSDNIKLKMDARRKYDQAKRDFDLKDVIIKKIMMKAEAKDSPDKSAKTTPASSFVFGEERMDVTESLEDDTAATIEFFDGGGHWCSHCNFFGNTVAEYLTHLHSEEHWAKIPENFDVPWPILRRFRDFPPERSLAPIKGSQFMIPSRGYYCVICKFFCGDLETAEEHMLCINHNRAVVKLYLTKPEYEHDYNKDRQSALSKNEADIRNKKRDAQKIRIRGEEIQKRNTEEKSKERERQVQDKMIEKNKYIERVKDLNDRTKKKNKKRNDKNHSRNQKKDSKKVYAIESSSEDEGSLDFLPPKRKKDPRGDIKIRKGCTVSIEYEDQKPAKRAMDKCFDKVFTFKEKKLKLVNNTWKEVTEIEKAIMVKQEENTEEKKTKSTATVDFGDDDSNDNINTSTVDDFFPKDSEGYSSEGSREVTAQTGMEADPAAKEGIKTKTSGEKDTTFGNSNDMHTEVFNELNPFVEVTAALSPTKTSGPSSSHPQIMITSSTKESSSKPIGDHDLSTSDPASNSEDVSTTSGISVPIQLTSPEFTGIPVVTLSLDCLRKSPTYMEEDT